MFRRWHGFPTDVARPDGSGLPLVLAVVERPRSGHPSLGQVAWMCRRLQASAILATIVEREVRWDELDLLRIRDAGRGLDAILGELTSAGVPSVGQLVVARIGEASPAALDLAVEYDPDLVVVLAERASRLRFLPGSRIAHQLVRRSGRPVVVVANGGPIRRSARGRPPGPPDLTVLSTEAV